MTTKFAPELLCTPTEALLRWRRPYFVAMATIRQPHCSILDSHCIVYRAMAFVLNMVEMCAVGRLSMRSHNVHCLLIWAAVEMPAILLCAPLRSAFEPWYEISINVVCATSKGSDQPAHTRNLTRALASRLNILWVLSYWRNFIWSFWA